MKKFNFKYGLMVLDKRQFENEEDQMDVIHFCGYFQEPNEDDAKLLWKELSEDEEFGLTKIAEHLIIIPATDEVLEFYRKEYENDTESDDMILTYYEN